MAHCLILGMTQSGKTTLAKKLAHGYRARGISVIVLDPLGDPEWPNDEEGTFQTRNRADFLRTVKASRQCAVFVDEAGESVGQYDDEMHWLATRGRHYGHQCHFLSQRGQQIAKTVRDQCSKMYLFCCSKTDGKILADEWNQEELRNVNVLGRGEFFVVSRFDPMRKGKVNLDKGESFGKIEIVKIATHVTVSK